MKTNLLNHIISRFLTGLIPIFLFALIIFSNKQSGNDFFGINFVKMILGFGSLLLWSVWVIIETFALFFKKHTYFAYYKHYFDYHNRDNLYIRTLFKSYQK